MAHWDNFPPTRSTGSEPTSDMVVAVPATTIASPTAMPPVDNSVPFVADTMQSLTTAESAESCRQSNDGFEQSPIQSPSATWGAGDPTMEQPIQRGIVRALVIGDPHVKKNNTLDSRQMIESIIETATRLHPDIIFVMGDTLDRFEAVHIVPQTDAVHWLARLRDIALVVLLIGNHDLENTKAYLSPYHPFAALHYWNNTIVVDKVKNVTMNGHVFTCVPFVDNGRFREALDTVDGWENSTAIFAHQEFKGCKLGHQLSEKGDEWPITAPYVISGHIHEYHEPQVNIVYVGTPVQHGFGDHDIKTVSLFTFHPSGMREQERIGLNVRHKRIIRIPYTAVDTFIPDNSYHLKIIIQGPAGELRALALHPTISYWKSLGHRVVEEATDNPPVRLYVEGQPIQRMRFHDVLRRIISINNPTQEVFDAYVKVYGRPVVQQAVWGAGQEFGTSVGDNDGSQLGMPSAAPWGSGGNVVFEGDNIPPPPSNNIGQSHSWPSRDNVDLWTFADQSPATPTLPPPPNYPSSTIVNTWGGGGTSSSGPFTPNTWGNVGASTATSGWGGSTTTTSGWAGGTTTTSGWGSGTTSGSSSTTTSGWGGAAQASKSSW